MEIKLTIRSESKAGARCAHERFLMGWESLSESWSEAEKGGQGSRVGFAADPSRTAKMAVSEIFLVRVVIQLTINASAMFDSPLWYFQSQN